MSLDTLSADLNCKTRGITLGTVTLFPDGYTMEEERPYESLRMWDGSWNPIPLGKKPCHLELRFRVPAAAGGALLSVLRAALKNKTAFAFSLAETDFSEMKLTAFSFHTQDGAMFCKGRLVFFGTAADPADV